MLHFAYCVSSNFHGCACTRKPKSYGSQFVVGGIAGASTCYLASCLFCVWSIGGIIRSVLLESQAPQERFER